MRTIDQSGVRFVPEDRSSLVATADTAAIADTQAMLAAIVDCSVDAIISKSLDGRIMTWNKSAQRIFGYTADEAIGSNITMLIPPDRLDEEPLILHRLKLGERVDHFETVRLARDGKRVDVSLTISPVINADGVIIGISKIARDITERKQLLEKLYEAQQLARESAESSDRAKDRFIAVLSHELRAPLNPILLALEMMERERGYSAEQQALLGIIRRNIELESRLIDDLLDATSIAKGKLSMKIGMLDLHQRVHDVIQICESEIRRNRHTLEIDLRARHPLIPGDATRIQQILWNLLKNAVKFTPAGGTIRICTRDASPDQIELSVQDSGIGIDPAFLPRVFEAFERGENGARSRSGGLGLGLSISLGLVQLHGGTLSAHSDGKGKGATFLLRLPNPGP
jgi:PAS domain S-box-containing protein